MLTPPTSPSTSRYSSAAYSFLTTRDPRSYKRKRAEDSYDSLVSLFNSVINRNGNIPLIDQNTWKKHFSGLDFEQALQITKFLFDNPTVVSHRRLGRLKG